MTNITVTVDNITVKTEDNELTLDQVVSKVKSLMYHEAKLKKQREHHQLLLAIAKQKHWAKLCVEHPELIAQEKAFNPDLF